MWYICDLKLNINEQWNLDLDHCASHTRTIPKVTLKSLRLSNLFKDCMGRHESRKNSRIDTERSIKMTHQLLNSGSGPLQKLGKRVLREVTGRIKKHKHKTYKKHRRQDQNLGKPMLNVDNYTEHMLLWHIKHDVLHDILHMTKLVTAMKAARAARVGFFISILAWDISRRRSTPTNRRHTYRNSFRSISASSHLADFFDKMQNSSASCARSHWSRASRSFLQRHMGAPSTPGPGKLARWLCSHPSPVKRYAERNQGQRWRQNPRNSWCFWTCFIFVFASLHFYYVLSMANQWNPNLWAYTFPCGGFAFGRPTGVK